MGLTCVDSSERYVSWIVCWLLSVCVCVCLSMHVSMSICVRKTICLLEHELIILYVGDCIYDDA